MAQEGSVLSIKISALCNCLLFLIAAEGPSGLHHGLFECLQHFLIDLLLVQLGQVLPNHIDLMHAVLCENTVKFFAELNVVVSPMYPSLFRVIICDCLTSAQFLAHLMYGALFGKYIRNC